MQYPPNSLVAFNLYVLSPNPSDVTTLSQAYAEILPSLNIQAVEFSELDQIDSYRSIILSISHEPETLEDVLKVRNLRFKEANFIPLLHLSEGG